MTDDTHHYDPGSELELVHDSAAPDLLTADEAQREPAGTFTLQLPDGHVLRLAAAEPGTVVEVASWTGPGRPGSDTARIMVGIGFESPQPRGELGGQAAGSSIEAPQDEIVVYEPLARRRPWAKPLGWTLAAAAVVTGLWFSPIVAVRPTAGSSVGLGATEDSVVIALPTDSVAVGQNVVAYLNAAHSAAVLGRVNQIAGNSVLIQTDQAFAQTSQDKVAGRVMVVIPFIGRLLRH